MPMPATGSAGADIYRVTHVANVPWTLQNGLHCPSSATQDPNFRPIGLPDLIKRRATRQVPIPPGGTLSDYVPFYFTSRTPMLLNIKTGWNVPAVPMSDLVLFHASLRDLDAAGVDYVFTDRHAYVAAARYSSNIQDLDRIDWDIIGRSDFAHDADDPGKKERYESEALVHNHLPLSMTKGIICSNPTTAQSVTAAADKVGVQIAVSVNRGCFF